MTEYEVLDMISTHRSEGALHVMNFAAAMFGYVAAAYFVGDKLSTFQTIAITILFCLFVPGPVLGVHESVMVVVQLSETYGSEFASIDSSSKVAAFAPIAVPGTIILGWVISMAFMFQIRREQNEPRT
ncbi:MAG: hypothetical protein ACI9BW_004508 [Gammaproteobacteria bacterium]|jgi:hypothetical protein